MNSTTHEWDDPRLETIYEILAILPKTRTQRGRRPHDTGGTSSRYISLFRGELALNLWP